MSRARGARTPNHWNFIMNSLAQYVLLLVSVVTAIVNNDCCVNHCYVRINEFLN